MKLISWNVNGIRAIYKKNLLDFIKKYEPDILSIQEIKAMEDQLPKKLINFGDYKKYFFSAERKGYSGVSTFTKKEPKNIKFGMDNKIFDSEGRTLITEFDNFSLFNIYFPNGKANDERLKYKMDFYYYLLDYLEEYKKTQPNIIICGDVNTAHKEIDLARPKENSNTSGFLIEEREWIDKLLESGFLDAFRVFNKKEDQYSWWDYKTKARERNVGWRIDYFFISETIKNNLKNAYHLDEIMGSDHCPIGIEIEI
ncbi:MULTISPECIES: exodeoxyribonuclease III [Oceanotoga]|uniref:Exodeoxyribonuclease-3 n=1 Tax=Oceanotoga teriensis TaxID=515440 RepID=A0AA45HHS4_9BACT|nr:MULTISPECIES: exodeoxyribonuclease III [Oceanotoga]MDN5342798.1 exodeoxyribonuclease [Oceanotoga sp.]MDO7977677.1 exodeoxyribonuclease III [Oceanotoga teriensis]PWJ87544.1 exodeoxyribonuclease-3 [Oceanotoga teriensis]